MKKVAGLPSGRIAALLLVAAVLAAPNPVASAENRRDMLAQASALRALGVLKPFSVMRKLKIFPRKEGALGISSAAIADLFASSLVRVGDDRIVIYSPIYALGVVASGPRKTRKYAIFELGKYDQGWSARLAIENASLFTRLKPERLTTDGKLNEVRAGYLVGRYLLWLERMSRHFDVLAAADKTIRAAFRLPKTAKISQIIASRDHVEFFFSPVQSGDKYLRITTDPAGRKILRANGLSLLNKG